MRATILGWSAVSGLVLGLIAGILLFAVLVLGSELLPGVPRLGGRPRAAVAVLTFVVLPLAGTLLGWLEGRLKLR